MSDRPTIISLCEDPVNLERQSAIQKAAVRVRQAQFIWKEWSLAKRLSVLTKFRNLVAENSWPLIQAGSLGRAPAEILTSEVIPLLDGCRFLERSAPRLLKPRKVGLRGRPFWLFGHAAEVQRVEWGVVLIVAPSNYPVLLPGIQLLQALAAGNGVLLKPGSGGTAAARALASMLYASGLPAHLIQIVGEDAAAGQAAVGSDVDKVFFTGSAATGRRVLQELAPRLVPATLELSGTDAMIVMPDAELSLSAKALAFGLRLNSGQTCIAPRRIFVASNRLQEFYKAVREAFQSRDRFSLPYHRLGAFLPVLRDAVDQGASVLAGFEMADGQPQFPLVLSNVTKSSPLWTEDFFLPVAVVAPFSSEEELLALLEQSRYALGASIFTSDTRAAQALAGKITAGVISINDLIVPTADPRLPFGGRGQSGFGSTRGAEGLLEMTAVKVVTTKRMKWHPQFNPIAADDAYLFVKFLRCLHGPSWGQRALAAIGLLKAIGARGRRIKSSRTIIHLN